MMRTTVRLGLLRALQPLARRLRGIGLGTAVDAVKRRAFTRSCNFSVEVHGIRLSGATVSQLNQVRGLRDGTREAYMTRIFEDAVAPGMVVVDVGAYIGYFTLLAARRAGSHGTVFSFEPHPKSFELLRRNVAQNGFSGRVISVRKAIAATDGRRPFFSRGVNESESGFADSRAGSSMIEVECVSADEFLAGRSVDVVKIDVEGAELEALEGMHQTLSASSSPTLFIEYNPDALRSAGADPSELLTRLHKLGFEVHVIDEDRRRLLPGTADVLSGIPRGGYVDLFCPSKAHRAARDLLAGRTRVV